jgi:phosphoenolpyruvate carboxylase
MVKASGWEGPMTLDLVPLFESIQDLDGAKAEMAKLYTHPVYAAHLDTRAGDQTVMLGFSDGTKDGGYLRANWAIYRAKQSLTDISREHGRTVMFFDGRGGPPARGGGNTHRFYASLGRDIENREIQTTIQGQTISSNFGIPKSAGFNLELLFTAGVKNRLFDEEETQISAADAALLDELGETSHAHYLALRNRPEFTEYLATFGTLKYYGATNIGSRPTSRAKDGAINFGDLRAIPFVGSWSQLKQNVPGYFGLGTALEALDRKGRLDEAAGLYRRNAFFRTLVENSMQSMTKCDFRLTAHLSDHPTFGGLWNTVHEEFERTRVLVLAITGQADLMETVPAIKESIRLRDSIIQPLLVIQQFALTEMDRQVRGESSSWSPDMLRKLIIRTMYGIVNASRNAV